MEQPREEQQKVVINTNELYAAIINRMNRYVTLDQAEVAKELSHVKMVLEMAENLKAQNTFSLSENARLRADVDERIRRDNEKDKTTRTKKAPKKAAKKK